MTEQAQIISFRAFRLTTGREVVLKEIIVRQTYADYMEGTEEGLRSAVLGDLADLVLGKMGRSNFSLLPTSSEGRLPEWTLMAHFYSPEPISKKADFSDAIIVWFETITLENLMAAVEASLAKVCWEAVAIDGHY